MLPDTITFTKLNAAGNDFVCIDNTDGRYNQLMATGPALKSFVKGICGRGLAVGADGLIFACQIGDGNGVDVVARFLEPDGSEARLCGNGTACFTYWAVDAGMLTGPEVHILTLAGTAQGRIEEIDPSWVRVCVPNPRDLQRDIHLHIDHQPLTVDYVDTGVPHAIAYVDTIDDVDVSRLGRLIRHHPRFAPEGVNANFVQVVGPADLRIRTFEFGVEDETLACGTGSAAAAILATLRHGWTRQCQGLEPVTVRTLSGDRLLIWFTCSDGTIIHDVCLETRVRPVFTGTLCPEFLAQLNADIASLSPSAND